MTELSALNGLLSKKINCNDDTTYTANSDPKHNLNDKNIRTRYILLNLQIAKDVSVITNET